MKYGTLSQLVDTYKSHIMPGSTVAVLKDEDGHFSYLFHSHGRIAHSFQEGFSPVVFPEMKYQFIGLCPSAFGYQFLIGKRTNLDDLQIKQPDIEA